ncbi:MAG: ABC transporter substrate-binding protein [Flavobacteriales bacterium]|nr:ABC transporter substrate-binding protein [Flavobacteriales bacterium]
MALGIILPSSSLYPHLSSDFMNGLRLGLGNHLLSDLFHFESIGKGSDPDKVSGVIQKLQLQHGCTRIIAWFANPLASSIYPLFTDGNCTLIHTNAGAHLPPEVNSPYVVYHSIDAWQSTWSLGKYMATQGLKKVFYIGTFYDGGYQTAYALDQGLSEGGAQITGWHIPKPSAPDFGLDILKSTIKESDAQAVFLSLSDPDAGPFLQMLHEEKMLDAQPVFCSPLMTASKDLAYHEFGTSLTSATSWMHAIIPNEDNPFVTAYLDAHPSPPSVFALLGYECGFLASLTSAGTPVNQLMHEKLATWRSPRGFQQFIPKLGKTESSHQLLKWSTGDTQDAWQWLDILPSPEALDEKLFKSRQQAFTLWKEPYFCN